ncbi:DMT family transporter [Desulforhopalus singaporensis]|uniref:Permease of the drug/metabolite transporter (DMT) superfamily n=1 Tax=Desulforhopalus singaporensis TaxID=91360 RepID=A0A1H0JWL5_9BACT|nr:DMT family transporter [Desulforhopalus singaporensis]SDO47893.1 Permease of the drug/metabolite transporter (DMT) superfamily [Desulforhopalus singaporensis]
MFSLSAARQKTGFSTPALATIALLGAMLLWSSSFIALKIAFRGYHPQVVIFGRMLVASLCFLLVAPRLARGLRYRKGDYKLILFMVVCEPCLYFLFEAEAVVNTTASQAGVVTAILPILTMTAAALFLKEKVASTAWIGAGVALGGVCWLTLTSNPSSDAPNPMLGNFLEFLAMVCATGYTISLKHLAARYSPFFLTALQAFAGTVFYFPLLFLPSTTIPDTFHLQSGLAILYLGAVITLGAYGLFNFALQKVPANKASSYVNLIPVFSVVLGWLVLGETLSAVQICATFVILAGVWFAQK